MSEFMQHLIQLRDSGMGLIYFVQKWDNPIFREFVKLLNYLDTKYFWLLFIPTIWVVFGRYYGRKIYYLFFLSGISNHFLKAFFVLVRPFYDDPRVGIIHVGGYGFPSGAAQNSILLCSLLITYWKSRYAWLVGIVFALMLSFSRVYLGVHYPLDILGGWIVGGALFVIYIYIFPIVERIFKGASPLTTLVANIVIFGLTFFFRSATVFYYSSIAIGIALGAFFIDRYKICFETRSLPMRILIQTPISIIGLAVILAANELTDFNKYIKDFLFLNLIGVWISYLSYYSSRIPEIFKKG